MTAFIEECPYCGNEIKPGVTVCNGCQAEKQAAGAGGFGWVLFVWIVLVIPFHNGPLDLVLVYGLILVLFICIFYKLVTRPPVWVRRHLR